MSIVNDMKADSDRADQAMAAVATSVKHFAACCEQFNWKAAELARFCAINSLDSYFDNVAALHMRVEAAKAGMGR